MDIKDFSWPKDNDRLISYLISLQDDKYKAFNEKITPGEFNMIGIRIPELRKIAKEILKTDYERFLKTFDDDHYEVKLIKGFVIGNIKDRDRFRYHFEEFIKEIDNWAVCDSFIASAKIILKDREYYFYRSRKLLEESSEFLNRVGFVILLDYFVDEEHYDAISSMLKSYKSGKYYADMAISWLLSEMYIRFPKKTQTFLIENHFDKTIIKYTARKIKDSYRVSEEDKKWLKKIS